ncbi:MAG: sigma-70 family RNA polymerase sigma factor [Myxococcales bacterium]|nr:sigma-70 family RNA polymerase sigma factor [Myxococcales bacterium]
MPAAHAPTSPAAPVATVSFRDLYDAHFSFVWRCLRGMGVPEAHVDDAVQEVFLVAHRRLADFRGDASHRTWLYGIVRHVAANHRRTLRRKGGHAELDPDTPSAAADPERRLQAQQRAAFVQRFADQLDDRRRDIFVLAVLEQLTIPEVAEILALPVNTAYTRLRSVRAEFRKAVRREVDAL